MFTRPIDDTILAAGALGANSSRSEATPASERAGASTGPPSSAQRGSAPSSRPSLPPSAASGDDEDDPLLHPRLSRPAARAHRIARTARRAAAARRRERSAG